MISHKVGEKGPHLVIIDQEFLHGEAGGSWTHPIQKRLFPGVSKGLIHLNA